MPTAKNQIKQTTTMKKQKNKSFSIFFLSFFNETYSDNNNIYMVVCISIKVKNYWGISAENQ